MFILHTTVDDASSIYLHTLACAKLCDTRNNFSFLRTRHFLPHRPCGDMCRSLGACSWIGTSDVSVQIATEITDTEWGNVVCVFCLQLSITRWAGSW